MARLMPTALAMSSIWASRTPRSSNSARVAAMISFSRARRRAAPAERRPSFSGARVAMEAMVVKVQLAVAQL
jgi:hypothetical protein